MPNYVVKPDGDEDFYVLWSEGVDAPTAYGDRDFMLTYHGVADTPRHRQERVERADETGSSALWPSSDAPIYGWWDKDQTFIVVEVEILDRRHDGFYQVGRDNLRALCERVSAGQDVTDLLTFEVWEDA